MGSCAPFSYNDANFRAQFPAFSNQAVYSPTTLSMYFCTAQNFVENTQYGFMNGCATQLALNLITAHFAQLATQIGQGQTPGIVTQSTIDKISVSIMEPPVKNMWQYWLAQTPYGQQLLAMLQAQSTGGFYTRGGAGRAGFGW